MAKGLTADQHVVKKGRVSSPTPVILRRATTSSRWTPFLDDELGHADTDEAFPQSAAPHKDLPQLAEGLLATSARDAS